MLRLDRKMVVIAIPVCCCCCMCHRSAVRGLEEAPGRQLRVLAAAEAVQLRVLEGAGSLVGIRGGGLSVHGRQGR